MAEPEKQALKKLEEEVTCAICLSDFQDPKLLHCFHVFCRDCLKKLVKGERGETSLCCPTCRHVTQINPGSGVGSLPAAFYIHHLFELKRALVKVKEPQSVKCQKCTKSTKIACSYCRDCGEFICEACTRIHEEWDIFKTHEVIPMIGFEEKLKEMKTLRKVTLKCSLHPGKELELYCEKCMELICHNCTVKKHKDHQYDLVDEVFEENKGRLISSGIPVPPKSGRIFIADTCNHRIQILNSKLSMYGTNGIGDGEFSYPHDIAFDSDGNVYVVDNSNHRIQIFEPDGKFLRTFGKHGGYDGELSYPSAISVDCSKNNIMYVSDKDNHRISMFTSKGKFITSFGYKGDGLGQFDMPHGISMAKNGVLYVCDFYNNRVQLFQ